MKKIGIITILKINNYGAELQSYALQRKLNLMGYDAEIIDYLFYKNPEHIKEKISEPFYPYPIQYKIKEYINSLRDKIYRLLNSKTYISRQENFKAFHEKFNKFSRVCYRSFSQLYDNPPQYDVYCVGSDQVWNPRCYTNLEPYFLTFAPQNSRKISYASSFGVSELPSSAVSKYRELLNQLDYIGVRENSGKQMVKRLTGREATLVADPTLLLDANEWNLVAKKPSLTFKDEYLLIYELQTSPTIVNLAKQIAKDKGLAILQICKDVMPFRGDPQITYIKDAGPSEFIYLISHASFVVTNSFHGTAFSINFNKDFYCVLKPGKNNNSRQLNLLYLCGMEGRVVYEGNSLPSNYNFAKESDKTKKVIELLRKQSCEYINTAINE